MKELLEAWNSKSLLFRLALATTASIFIGVIILVSQELRQSAKLNLGSSNGLQLTADKKDSLGIFSDTTFTLRSDVDLTLPNLKENLLIFPEIDFDLKEINPRQFSLTPKQSLNDHSLYRIKILSGEKDFSWAFETRDNFRVIETLPRDKATYVPTNTGIEITFSHENWENIDNFFEISPPVKGKFERHKRTSSFVPESLLPSTLYTVRIKKGLKLQGSESTLGEDYIYQFETQPLSNKATLSFAKNFYEFSPTENPAFDIYSSSGELDLSVTVYQYPSLPAFSIDFDRLNSSPTWATTRPKLTSKNLPKILEFSTSVQKQTYINFFLLPQTLPSGYYLIESSLGDTLTHALVQVTDLSAYLTISGSKTLVWVNDITSRQPVSGANVSVAGINTKTGTDGVAYFDTSPSDLTGTNTTVTVTHDNRQLLLPSRGSGYYYSRYSENRRQEDRYWSYFYSDRPVYLPDDTLNFWGLLRDRDHLDERQNFTLEISRSDYTGRDFGPVIIHAQEIQTSELGTFTGKISLNKYSPGWYSISLKIADKVVASSSFSIDSYTKPAYKLTLSPSQRTIIAGGETTFSGQATFFEGSPVPNLGLKYSGPSSGILTSDSLGKYNFRYTTSAGSITTSYSPEYRYFSLRPSLPEEGDIEADASIAVFGSSVVFSSPKSSTKSGEGIAEVVLKKVDTDIFTNTQSIDNFLVMAGRIVTGSLFENQWHRRAVGTYYDFINKTTSTRYEYDRIQNKITDFSLTTDSNGLARYSFPINPNGSYTVTFQSVDDEGRIATQEVYLAGTSSNYYPNNFLYLKTDKNGTNANKYNIGENVNLSVMNGESPLQTSNTDHFLYLFAKRGLVSYKLSDDNHLSFPYQDSFVPNIVVRSIRFTGNTYQESEALWLTLDTSSKKISLDISTDKPTYTPGDTAKVSILSKDYLGHPVQSEVNLNLLDDAYQSLFYTSVDPLSRIYRSLDPDIIASYYSHRYPLDASGAEGGGCFLSGTKITMSDGSLKSIENIKIGDKIKTYDSPLSRKSVFGTVSQVFSHRVSGYIVVNGHLRVTPEHNLYINGRWLVASDIRVGDSFLDQSGEYQKVTSLENRPGINNVYNFSVQDWSTYFADGFYVHNEKGRDLFVDNAYFNNVTTDTSGRASIEIKLPDNLTSWSLISQAVTSDLKAGSTTSRLITKQAFFVDSIMNSNYLSGEKPRVIIRSFGDGLVASDSVTYKVEAPTLGINQTFSGQAFKSLSFDLGELREGQHQITISGSSGQLSDKITRQISVSKSRLKINKSSTIHLDQDSRPQGSSDTRTALIFSDFGIGRYLSALIDLSSTWGDRFDQRLVRHLSQLIIQNRFDKSLVPEFINSDIYFSSSGGYSLLPYSSPDLFLSSFTAALARDKVDRFSLTNYLYQELYKSEDSETAALSLFGLASLDEPVLTTIDNLSQADDLSSTANIYLALARAAIGDTEKARIIYRKLLSQYSEAQDTFTIMKIGSDKDDYLLATSLTASLASYLEEREVDNLLNYTLNNSTKEVLLILPQLLTITNQINHHSFQPASFSYTLSGKKISKKLENGQAFKIDLSPQELSTLSFADIAGEIGLTSSYLAPLDTSNTPTETGLTIGRRYLVNGIETSNFSISDLIKVSLPVTYPNIAQDGCYQVSDYLPSGLRAVSSVYRLGLETDNIWYPYEINGQKVSFCLHKSPKNNTINYYARVISSGEYFAESAIIQSLLSPSVLNFSPAGTISIK